MGGEICDLTLVDSSDDDALFTVPRRAAARALPSRVMTQLEGSFSFSWHSAIKDCTVKWQQVCSVRVFPSGTSGTRMPNPACRLWGEHVQGLLPVGTRQMNSQWTKCLLMRSVPRFLWGSFRVASKMALEEILKGEESGNLLQQERVWKLFLLFPRMMLHRSPTGGGVPKAELVTRFDRFALGQWRGLVVASKKCSEDASMLMLRRRCREVQNQEERRALRAMKFVRIELSSGRQVLEGAVQTAHCFLVLLKVAVCVLHPGKPRFSCHARDRLAPGIAGSATTGDEVAQGIEASSQRDIRSQDRPPVNLMRRCAVWRQRWQRWGQTIRPRRRRSRQL